ncbi:hypothetical protein L0B82_09435 [Mycobacterium intracellulare subsp. intracellulare]|uniref:Uncharacterized protein n=1 Tax=Mycobacterium intracellulare subsp. chimaera TaxID=222805 RepID=A0ABT7P361_MYCIT|nr:hypothetical protein [Mycobacterium intracellulare]MCF1812595.1 hypothetical protein [Mycobacterium intracellulare subsp. intracellulare]MDM3927393.1 hypothetical protein [Mycobacterium intracellulare subsp. chimaera]MDS0333828.1 hypothetical protein [Mycobacterium intracellulare]
MTDLVGCTARGIFRDLMTDSTVGAITTAFQDEGFAADPDCRYEDSSVRRQITPAGPQLSIESIARLADPSAIREGFERIRRAMSDDPALAVGSAKELIEKHRQGSPSRTRPAVRTTRTTYPNWLAQHSFRSGWTPRPGPDQTAATALSASWARSQPSPTDLPSCATADWAPDTGRQPHASVSAADTHTSRSTRRSPGAS